MRSNNWRRGGKKTDFKTTLKEGDLNTKVLAVQV